MLDLMTVSNNLEELLKKGGYCGGRIGSGCTTFGNPIRDFQYEYGKKKITKDILDELLKKVTLGDINFYVSLKLNDDDFSVYVNKNVPIEEVEALPCEEKEKVLISLQVAESALVDTIIVLSKDKRIHTLQIWNSSDGFDVTCYMEDDSVEKL